MPPPRAILYPVPLIVWPILQARNCTWHCLAPRLQDGAGSTKTACTRKLIPLLFFTACPNLNDESDKSTVTSVTVTPTTITVAKGKTQQFTVAVSGDNNPAQTVTWSIVETGKAAGTAIDTNGLLTVAAGETLSTLTVKAASTVDTSKSGTATVSVFASAEDIPTVTAVTVSPSTATVAKGGTKTFTAAVTGTNSPAQTVTWSIVETGKAAGTAIDTNGLLTVAAGEPLSTLTVKAASTVDTSKSGTATVTVTVTEPPVTTVTSIAGIRAYLLAASGGLTADDPAPLKVQLHLPHALEGWTALLDEIQNAGRFVALDLSASTISGTEYDPGTANSGKSWIVSLVLPNAATSVKAGSGTNSSFMYFTALTSVSGSAVETIGTYAFRYRDALTTVSFPAATSIGDSAFSNCEALTSVILPAATSIGNYAFNLCEALTSVSLPAATSIGDYAFNLCEALTSVSLPAATSIGNYAFNATDGTALTVTLGSTAPTLGYGMCGYSSTTRTVIVKVPSGATGYGTLPATYSGADSTVNWGNGFRGKGWNGRAFVGGGSFTVINNKITLTIQAE